MKKLLFSIIATVFITTISFAQSINDYNKQFDIFKNQQNLKSEASIVKFDDEKPANLDKYLVQAGLEKEQINTISHLQIDTKSNLGIMETYALQYSKDDYTKYLIIVKDPKFEENYVALNAKFNFKDNTVSVVGMTHGKRSWSKCFGDCLTNGLDSHGLLGQVIILTGAAGVVCPPCGFVSATYVGVLALGCAGGCMP